jgi:hypothetical protein
MILKKFTGFKGVVAFAQIGEVQFALLATNPRQLQALWSHVMANAGPLDPAGIKKAILIEASTLPDHRPPTQEPSPGPANPNTTIDV